MTEYLLNQNTTSKFGLQTLFNWIVPLNFRFLAAKKEDFKNFEFSFVIRNYVTFN